MYSTVTSNPVMEQPSRVKQLANRTADSFRQDKSGYVSPTMSINGSIKGGRRVFNAQAAASNTANAPLARKLKNRHLQMIAIGGSIGTGLFISSGSALATGGPASLLLAYLLTGAVIFFTIQALGEMAVLFPVAGSFNAFATRFMDPAWGFAMGWNYALQWLVVMPLEIMAASLTFDYWNVPIPKAVSITVFLFAITLINLHGVKAYGESETLFSILKVVAVIGFIILGAIINCVGTDNTGYIGGRYWMDPGAFNNGFRGFCSVLVVAAFAFSGTELVGLAAAETYNPSRSIPTAVKQVFWRISLFYILSITVVGLLVPYTNESLFGSTMVDTSASPFVIAIRDAGIQGLDSVMNAVIMIAVLSVANSSLYASSRTIVALAEQGQAPKFFGYIDNNGRPLVGIFISAAMGLIAYSSLGSWSGPVFTWLLAISGLSSIFTWATICMSHVRFRKAWMVQGHSLDELAYKTPMGVVGSWIGFFMLILVLVAQFWVAIDPVGGDSLTPSERVESFFALYLALPIVLLFYGFYKIYYRTSWVRIEDIDLKSGKQEVEASMLPVSVRQERATWPMWKVIYRSLC